MPAKAGRRTGLSSLFKALRVVCRAVDVFGPMVRRYVRSADLASYDAALVGIKAACAVILALDLDDGEPGTNPPADGPR